jgi:hypothetical protein
MYQAIMPGESAPGRDRTCDHRIRRVIDNGHWAFYLRLCLQSITLELLYLLGSTPVRVTTRVTESWLRPDA